MKPVLWACLTMFVIVSAMRASMAHAQFDFRQPQGGTDLFTTLDMDGNDAITPNEAIYIEELMNRFDALDQNKDGRLSRKEFRRLTAG
jgi:Ca2+-binding EF-hand superfamily protein